MWFIRKLFFPLIMFLISFALYFVRTPNVKWLYWFLTSLAIIGITMFSIFVDKFIDRETDENKKKFKKPERIRAYSFWIFCLPYIILIPFICISLCTNYLQLQNDKPQSPLNLYALIFTFLTSILTITTLSFALFSSNKNKNSKINELLTKKSRIWFIDAIMLLMGDALICLGLYILAEKYPSIDYSIYWLLNVMNIFHYHISCLYFLSLLSKEIICFNTKWQR